MTGESYGDRQLSSLRARVDGICLNCVRSLAFNDLVVIRLKLAESKFSETSADLATTADAALARFPAGSFLWLVKYWLQRQSAAGGISSRDLSMLRQAYQLGPNEGWIAVRRSPLVLSSFNSLPLDLQGRALAEFADLVRGGLYLDAANILVGPGWAVREQLMNRIALVPDGDRVTFAKILRSRGLDEITVPSVSDKPARPF
ncbi:hypothetical protein C7G41_28690 [Bradyrhizobium sp. MOS002]|nr:hypothetical protein C7G41_28690 [Bradyrhizobium sp. MOS002]